MFRRSFIILQIILVSFLGISIPVDTHAQTADELQASANALKDKIAALDKEIKEFNKKIAQTQGEAKSLKQALAALELRRVALITQIDQTNLKITQAQGNISTTQANIVVTSNRLEKNKSGLAETLRSLVYQNDELPPFMRVLGKKASLSDVFD